ncbi:response regulator transcription factor [Flavitalea sp. BT771]|uniref:response regulator n=1 Tax=Flavitalea sp. BT771 TaxID=3063329 RepID=UPI0026E1E9B9|nr:response regulator transcription factor [Flavitalea sp. BT771]MDO6431541.1 response regulator transcription factor [Flavitalea sp. BT771]MDV6220449.1 response regulator transcription factor [Flavitalea sp. BT771]
MRVRDSQIMHVLVADQHRIVRAGIKSLLSETGSWQQFQVDEAESTEEAIAMVCSGEYGVVLMEYGLPGRGGIKATEILMARRPGTCILILTDMDDGSQAERIIRAGARGVILKNIGLDTLVFAIRTVMTGKQFYSNEIAIRLLERKGGPQDPLERLTAREKEVFKAILEGLGGEEIAARMHIHKRTVDKHRQHINYKLGIRTPLELVQVGLRLGLISIPTKD